jgi:predicted Zn-ribbon and HTH transcriptional regulator
MNRQELIEYTAFLLYFKSLGYNDIEDAYGDVVRIRKRWKNESLLEKRDFEHRRNCVKQPSRCPKCMMVDFFRMAEEIVKGYNDV